MKIVVITTVALNPNGITTFIENEYSMMIERFSCDVTVLSPVHTDAQVAQELSKRGINLVSLNRSRPLKYVWETAQCLKELSPDLVHIQGNSSSMILELLASKIARVKMIATHSHNTTSNHPVIHKLLRPFLNYLTDLRLACGTAAGKWLYGSRTRFHVVENSIPLEQYQFDENSRYTVRRLLDIPSDATVVGHVGMFNSQKNQSFLVNLARKTQDNKSVFYVLIGDGPDFDNIRRVVVDEKLSHVILVGRTDNVSKYLSTMDVFFLPSLYEGLPFVVIEALSNGLSCVLSDRVSKESALAGIVKFRSLNKIYEWLDCITENGFNVSNRVLASKTNIQQLVNHGYGLQASVDKLATYFDVKKD